MILFRFSGVRRKFSNSFERSIIQLLGGMQIRSETPRAHVNHSRHFLERTNQPFSLFFENIRNEECLLDSGCFEGQFFAQYKNRIFNDKPAD